MALPEGNVLTFQTTSGNPVMIVSLEKFMKILGRRFALDILQRMLFQNHNKFGQFMDSIEGISSKMLSQRLYELESLGLITRKIIPDRPVRTEYLLTEKGLSLESLIEEFILYMSS